MAKDDETLLDEKLHAASSQQLDGNKPVQDESKPSQRLIHAALIVTQCIFGGGSVVGKLGVSAFNPVLFALIREGCAGPILVCIAWYKDRIIPDKRDLWLFALAGSCLFGNQLGFIVGDKLSSAVIGSAWQPTQPIFSATIAICLGWERNSVLKFLGILVAFLGAAFMVTTDAHTFGKISVKSGSSDFTGNILFFINCLGTALYVICAKKLLEKYPPTTVTGYSYILASLQMALTAVIINTQADAVKFVCPLKDCDSDCDSYNNNHCYLNSTVTDKCYDKVQDCGGGMVECSCSAWGVPGSAVLPLLYWIAFNSVVAYLLMTWATKHAPPSAVLGYTALQPLTADVLVLIITSFTSKYDLTKPGYNMIGAVGIVIGLYLLIGDHLKEAREKAAAEAENEEYDDIYKNLKAIQ